MIAVLFVMGLTVQYPEYFEMVDKQLKEGYTFEYVGKTKVTDEIALPMQTDDGNVYFYYLKAPKDE